MSILGNICTYIKMTNVIFTITFQGIKNYHKYGTQRKIFTFLLRNFLGKMRNFLGRFKVPHFSSENILKIALTVTDWNLASIRCKSEYVYTVYNNRIIIP